MLEIQGHVVPMTTTDTQRARRNGEIMPREILCALQLQ